jgi:hypothetical protein
MALILLNNLYSSGPLQCDVTTYEYFATNLNYPTLNYAAQLIQDPRLGVFFNDSINVSLDQIRSNFISVNFYFRFIRYTSIKDVPRFIYVCFTFPSPTHVFFTLFVN